MPLDFDLCYRALKSRDARFDGSFFAGVTSTGIYCRPSCPARSVKRSNIRFFHTAAAAQGAGFRACKRCRPDASPGSPEWDVRADLVGRAMRLIADGVVDRNGVGGLAGRLHVSPRHLQRQLVAEVGAAPQALARAQRAQTARVLIETTTLPFTEVAFGAGFASVRQFNDTIKKVFATTPTELRRKHARKFATPGTMSLRLPYRAPFDGGGLLAFLGTRAISGIESYDGTVYRRALRLPASDAIVELEVKQDYVRCDLRLGDIRDLGPAVRRCRQLLDLDADPIAVDEALGDDRVLGSVVRSRPGRRLPGSVDGFELAVRAVLGQQVSVAGALTIAGRLVRRFGKPLTAPDGHLTHVFPEPAALVDADLSELGVPGSRRETVRTLAGAVAAGDLVLDRGADRTEVAARLLSLRGVGPWTASYIAMRALGDPDVFLPGDLGVRRALEKLGHPGDPDSAQTLAERWRPWRSYAVQYLWTTL
ncbi:MAG: helix-turn-helix domain-containing protein [Actinobacteria bacterium]|nr:helix-turn-helix domain-containing protein [Actinomycetota bacterium]